MTKDEALKLALEALELHGQQYPHMVKGYCLDAITAIREALAEQPAQQEPVAWDRDWEDAYASLRGMGNGMARAVDRTDAIRNGQVPAVAAAAWRLLTANTISDYMKTWNSHSLRDIYYAIEDKLKEKNHV